MKFCSALFDAVGLFALCLLVLWESSAVAATSLSEGTLVFQSDRNGNWDLYLIEADGEDLRPLTRHASNDMHPAWSPAGDLIAFASERTGSGDIYVMRSDGSGVRRLTEHPSYEGAPSWSPDGKWIVFEGERDGRSELYRVEVATGEVERLTQSLSRKLGPDYSPDGTHLAYMNRGIVRWQVALLDLANGRTEVLTEGWGSCRPDFSPDGRFLAFVSTQDSDKADIRLRDMTRETDWKLESRRNAHNYDPSFSPDGLTLVFASTIERRPEQWDLYLVDINGRNLKPLTPDPSSERFPDWRPLHPTARRDHPETPVPGVNDNR